MKIQIEKQLDLMKAPYSIDCHMHLRDAVHGPIVELGSVPEGTDLRWTVASQEPVLMKQR